MEKQLDLIEGHQSLKGRNSSIFDDFSIFN